MRILLSMLALSSCYGPEFPEGRPCSASLECPGDLLCDPIRETCVREILPAIDAAPDANAQDAAAIDVARPACIEGDLQAEDPATGHCYAHIAASANWPTARAQCAALGAGFTLAAITSENETAFIQSFAPASALWVGGNDIATETSFVWVTGEPFGYENWRAGEPNNGMGIVEEDCLALEADLGGGWDDRPCGDGLPVLCERD